jgi:hypothetical protein
MRAGSNVTDYGVDQAQQAYIDCIVMRPLVAQMSVFRHPEVSLLLTGRSNGTVDLDHGALTSFVLR